MDKNTITGMVLIFLVLIVFSYLSRPSQEQLAAQQQYYDSIAQVQQRAAELQAKAEAALAASLFHYKELEIKQVKEYLRGRGISVRL